MSATGSIYRNSTVLITGGTGSIGMELARVALDYQPKRIRLFSNDENGLFEAQNIFSQHRTIDYVLGDVRDRGSVENVIAGSEVVFHAAALKHVDSCEKNPYEAICTNILGTSTVIDCAIKSGVSRFVYISTDKAVNPVGAMGASKLLGEKLTIGASTRASNKTILSCVRFGNVLGSRGSVLRIFERQVRSGQAITVTDPNMTRFVMLPTEAARLVLHASEVANSGETLVLNMKAIRIGDLADACRSFFAEAFHMDPEMIKIQVIGRSLGEKIHEELMTGSEALRAYRRDSFYVIKPDQEVVGSSAQPAFRALSSDLVPLLSRSEMLSVLSTIYKRDTPIGLQ